VCACVCVQTNAEASSHVSPLTPGRDKDLKARPDNQIVPPMEGHLF